MLRRDTPLTVLTAAHGQPHSRFADIPGVGRLHYEEQGLPDGAAVVFLHGMGGSAHNWAAWTATLRGYWRLALDLPGHGLSDIGEGADLSMSSLVAALSGFLGHLGLGPVVLVGHSMGAEVAWRFTRDHPDRVRALVLVSATGWPDDARRIRRRRPLAWLFGLRPLQPLLAWVSWRPQVRRSIQIAYSPQPAPHAAVELYTALAHGTRRRRALLRLLSGWYRRGFADPADFKGFNLPTLVMAGEQDRLTSPAHARRFVDAIPGARLILYPGVGHMPMVTRPRQSARDLRRWLGEVLGRVRP
jgi:pimeloyl-ACP methyl ester carboxylesterase